VTSLFTVRPVPREIFLHPTVEDVKSPSRESRGNNDMKDMRGWKREGRSGKYDAVKERRTNSEIDM